jgi:phage terminase large subunit-like protein
LTEQIQKAEGMPARQRRIKRLNFCIWDDAGPERAIEPEIWKACSAPFDVEELHGHECYGGLDLSAVNDLTALVLVFPHDDRMIDVLPFFWLPADGLAEKERRDKVPYQLWRDQNLLEVTPGRTIDDWFVVRRLEQLGEQFDIRQIAYDRWGMEKFKGTIRNVGAEIDEDKFVSFGQGYASMGPAIKELEKLLQEQRIRHGMHPILTMCAGYAVCDRDPADNRKWAKNKAEQRIDGIVALTMAVGTMAERDNLGPSVYEERGLIMI